MKITTVKELKEALRAGERTDLGGYPTYFVTSYGHALSHKAVREDIREIMEALTDKEHVRRERITSLEINYEDPDLYCEGTGERIPSAYAEPEE